MDFERAHPLDMEMGCVSGRVERGAALTVRGTQDEWWEEHSPPPFSLRRRESLQTQLYKKRNRESSCKIIAPHVTISGGDGDIPDMLGYGYYPSDPALHQDPLQTLL